MPVGRSSSFESEHSQMSLLSFARSNGLRFYCATKMWTASEARELDVYRECSNRLLAGPTSRLSLGPRCKKPLEHLREVADYDELD
jgi:hypothetical protein